MSTLPGARHDYVYLVEADRKLYVGQATTPGRALKHWFGSHNKALAEAVDKTLKQRRWPSLSILPLQRSNLEDLNNLETLLIWLLKEDRRTAGSTVNRSPGSSLFTPQLTNRPQQALGPGVVALDWKRHTSNKGDNYFEFTSATVSPHARSGNTRELTAPFLFKENAEDFIDAVTSLWPGPVYLTQPWRPFFAHLEDFVPGLTDLPDPVQGPLNFKQLAAQLGAPYVLVNLSMNSLDERGAVGVGLTEPVLRARAEKWWSRHSLSLTGGPNNTLQHAENADDDRRPRYVVASVGGTGGRRVVLAVWPLQGGSWAVAGEDSVALKDKLVLPITQPDPRDAATAHGAASIGTLLKDSTSLGGKGAFWVDTRGSSVL